MIEDLAHDSYLAPKLDDIAEVLMSRKLDFVSYEDWQRLDAWEQQEGTTRGKCRHKLPSVDELMGIVRKLRTGALCD
jgi:ferredoxin--NADP+ reductase